MSEAKQPAKRGSKKLTVKSLKSLTDLKAGGEPVVTGTGKKKMVKPSETG